MKFRKAVLFDYDGVLADTMQDMYAAWSFALNVYKKVKVSKTFFFLLEGMPAQKMSEKLIKEYNIDKGVINDIIKQKDDYYSKNNKFKINDKTIRIVNYLKQRGVFTAIVSGAPRRRIYKMISPSILSKFHTVVTSDDVRRGKPEPEPFLKAVKKLKVRKQDTIVIENAPLGVESAKKAGIYCIAVESTLQKKYLLKADKIFKDFDDLYIYFKQTF